MAKATVQEKKKHLKNPRQPQHPQQRQAAHSRRSRAVLLAGAAGLVALVGIGIALLRGPGDDAAGPEAAPLPNTSDYHSLLASPDAPGELALGTHQGLFRSRDGGRSWAQAELVDQDAMNLARSSSETVWAAGHNVFARSEDGGTTWQDLRPAGMPSLDLHGFAVDREAGRLWAAVAGEGLYGSTDGGASFDLVTAEVGAGVMGLEVLPGGRLLAADMEAEALLASDDGARSWTRLLDRPVMAVAAAPGKPSLLLASALGKDAGIVRSADGGRSWALTLPLPNGPGPVAWSESEPRTAYAVSLDRTLYRSTDAGATWRLVAGEAG